MPPLKTYIFQHTADGNIRIEIKAYKETGAFYLLSQIARIPTDYKLQTSN